MVERGKTKGKPNNSSLLIIGIIVCIIIILVAVALSGGLFTGKVTDGPNCYDKNVSYEKQVQTVEYYTETVPYTEQECDQKQLAYKVDNFNMDENTCLDYDELCRDKALGLFCTDKVTFCVNKVVTCSLDFFNLDSEEQGIWKVRMIFYDTSSKSTIDEKEMSYRIYPQDETNMLFSTEIQSTNPEGDANKGISCRYEMLSLAEKTVCKDVTRYKDVQREKVVTKPVTDYKIEKVCE